VEVRIIAGVPARARVLLRSANAETLGQDGPRDIRECGHSRRLISVSDQFDELHVGNLRVLLDDLAQLDASDQHEVIPWRPTSIGRRGGRSGAHSPMTRWDSARGLGPAGWCPSADGRVVR